MITLKDKVRRAYLAGAPLAIAARAHDVRPGTARRWLLRHQWQRPLLHSAGDGLPPAMPPPAATPAPSPAPSLWCRSLHHDWSHLVKPDGTAECDPRVTVPLGGRWFPIPADELDSVRKCKRCMPHQDARREDTRREVPGSGLMSPPLHFAGSLRLSVSLRSAQGSGFGNRPTDPTSPTDLSISNPEPGTSAHSP